MPALHTTLYRKRWLREDSASTGRKCTAEILISGPNDWGGRQKEARNTVSMPPFFSSHLAVFVQGLPIFFKLWKKYCCEKVTYWVAVLKLPCAKTEQENRMKRNIFPNIQDLETTVLSDLLFMTQVLQQHDITSTRDSNKGFVQTSFLILL